MVPYFRETVVVVMGTHTGSFQKVMERCPWEWELSLPFWLSGPQALALHCHTGEGRSPQWGRECAVICSLTDSPQPPLGGGETSSLRLLTDDSPPMGLGVLSLK